MPDLLKEVPDLNLEVPDRRSGGIRLNLSTAFTGLSIRAKMVSGGRPLLRENLPVLTHPVPNADFQSIFARSASAVTPSEKTSYTNRKSTTSFPMILR